MQARPFTCQAGWLGASGQLPRMDAITRISYYFPTHALTSFWIISNLIINNAADCSKVQRQIIEALVVIFCFIVLITSFTDTYTATNGVKFWVLIIPLYGPVCFALPTEVDKDRLWDGYYLKIRDYVHALLSMLAFLLITLFCNPVCMCVFPSTYKDGTARFDPAVVRTVPIVVAIILALVMVCLGPPRQMLGFGNVPETRSPSKDVGADNPIYAASYPPTKEAASLPDDSGLEMGMQDNELRRDVSNFNGHSSFYGGKDAPSLPVSSGRATGAVYGGGKSSTGRDLDQGYQGDRAPVRDSYRDNNSAPSPRGGMQGNAGYDQGYPPTAARGSFREAA